jgi:hypothetical protein
MPNIEQKFGQIIRKVTGPHRNPCWQRRVKEGKIPPLLPVRCFEIV